MKYISVGYFKNDTDRDMKFYLEVLCEEIWVAPGLGFELLIEDHPDSLPVHLHYIKDGLQIFPNRHAAEWLIRFNGKDIKPDYPTVLKDHE